MNIIIFIITTTPNYRINKHCTTVDIRHTDTNNGLTTNQSNIKRKKKLKILFNRYYIILNFDES